jgi:hypothetical protein
MWADPKYLRSWRDLRRRDLLFWFFVLSYVPVVRGVGLIRSMSDIRNTMLTAANGTPVFLSDIAEIVVGNKPRLGTAGRDEHRQRNGARV